MGMNVVWDTPDQKILRMIFQPRWTRATVRDGLDMLWQTLDQIDTTAHIIFDQNALHIPASEFLAHAKLIGQLSDHPHAGSLVIVGADLETQKLCQTASYRNTLCQNLHFVDTLEDAYTVLSQLDFVAGLNDMMDGWVR